MQLHLVPAKEGVDILRRSAQIARLGAVRIPRGVRWASARIFPDGKIPE